MQYSYQTVVMFDVSGRWQWRVNDCVWPGSQALRWKRKRRKVSRKSPRTDFLQPPVWRLELNLKLYFLVVFGGRYDKVSESLALRILNIKNIPRNNKDVSWIQYKCGLNVLRVAQDELIFLHLFRLERSTKPSFQFVSFLTREVRDEPIKHQTLSGANKIFFFKFYLLRNCSVIQTQTSTSASFFKFLHRTWTKEYLR